MKNQKGFSLIELMVVVAIIGILAAVAVPNFSRFQNKAKQSEAKSNLTAIYAAEQAFKAEWNAYLADFRDIGYSPEGRLRYVIGFGAENPAIPVGYTQSTRNAAGLPGGPAAGTCFNSGVGAVGACFNVQNAAPAFAVVAAAGACGASANPTNTVFSALARADLLGNGAAANHDQWTMTNTKILCNNNLGF